MVENGKCSPSVGTLQQLASALEVPIVRFFETKQEEKNIVYQKAVNGQSFSLSDTVMINLAEDLAGRVVQPFKMILQPGRGSGDRMIVHTGHEFVYCLSGSMQYSIQGKDYLLSAGDSLVFEANLPHCWVNIGDETTEILLVLFPSSEKEELGGSHFINQGEN
jgi:quercetin dioxygenase-like cupin family protein